VQISLTARHCEIRPEIRMFAVQRLERLNKFASDILEAHVIITQEKHRHEAEIKLHVKHHELVSTETSDHAQVAIDLAADRLEEQLRRLKDRRLDRKQRSPGGRGLNGQANGAATDDDDTGLED
jgi:putative sigma-54 modulation protein